MSESLRADWLRRLQALRGRLAAAELDAVVVSTPSNIRYLTGFRGSAGLLIVTAGEASLLVDGRYIAVTVADQGRGVVAPVSVQRAEGRYDVALGRLLKALPPARIGFEASHVTVATRRHWEAESGRVLEPTEGLIEAQRVIKDAGEIATLRNAADKLSDVARLLPSLLGIGQSEREVAAAIDRAIVGHGFDKPAFETIVASGLNGAYPHARPTDRRIQAGELVVLDFGGILDGYCVDLTRAACAAPVSPACQAMYDAVRLAQEAAMAAVAPGIAVSDVDRAARQVLETRGFADVFVHGTGHGLGLDVHEAPHLAPNQPDTARLDAGMVLTIEPGVYVEGIGGVRLEDDLLVTTNGCEVLTKAPRDLLAV